VFLASGSAVIGQVELGEDVSVWFNVVIRGDVNTIKIGARTNIQDNSTVHVTNKTGPTLIGSNVTIGHNCVIHACEIGDRSLIGMGSTILDGAVIESECFIAAGSVVTPGKRMPSGMMCMGSPAKPVRPLSSDERTFLLKSSLDYIATAKSYSSAEVL
jgi:carbonic anhydrase/acetyltransferase-like protein (isoleucine patch superfamily)